jgi:hypothetical protein
MKRPKSFHSIDMRVFSLMLWLKAQMRIAANVMAG